VSHLVSSRTDSSSAVSFQLEDAFGDGGSDLVEFLLSVVPGIDPKSTGGAFSQSSDAPSSWKAVDHLGWLEEPPKRDGPGLCAQAQRKAVGGVFAGLCSGAQSGGIPLGILETSRTAEFLS